MQRNVSTLKININLLTTFIKRSRQRVPYKKALGWLDAGSKFETLHFQKKGER